MPARDTRVDAYIERAADFAQPILIHLRAVVHSASPLIQEDIKWGVPYFTCHGLLCGMAAFKRHVAFGFWNDAAIKDRSGTHDAMWQFGRITMIEDLPPPAEIRAYVQTAIDLNERGIKPARRGNDDFEVPQPLLEALARHPRALAEFEAMTPGRQREYAVWIAGAKRDATREKRIATAVEWIAEGKVRDWKYQTKKT